MTETLKTIRLIQRLVLGVSGAVIVFSLAPGGSALLDEAIAELEALRVFVERGGPEELLDHAREFDDQELQGVDLYDQIYSGERIHVVDLDLARIVSELTTNDGIDSIYISMYRFHTTPVFTFGNCLRSRSDEVAALIGEPTEDGLTGEDRQAAIDNGIIWKGGISSIDASGVAEVTVFGGDMDTEERYLEPCDGVPATDYLVDELLEEHGLLDGSGALLPALGGLILDLREASFDMGVAYLLKEKALDTTTINIAGLQVPTQTLAIVAPAILLFALLYMQIHLLRLARVDTPADKLDPEGIWIGTFEAGTATTGVHMTLWSPLVASIVLLLSVDGWGFSAVIAILLALSIAASAFFCSRTFERFRQQR